jgi:hypothetical protein
LYHFFVVELVSANLPQLQILTWKAQPKWFNLGLAVGIDETKLKTIRLDFHTVEEQFTEMLSVWLRMSSPQRSWESLVTALKQPTVGFSDLAKSIKEKFGIMVQSVVPEGTNVTTAATATTDSDAGQFCKYMSVLF